MQNEDLSAEVTSLYRQYGLLLRKRAQEAFIDYVTYRTQHPTPPNNPAGLLYCMVTRHAVTLLRKRARQPVSPAPDARLWETHESAMTQPQDESDLRAFRAAGRSPQEREALQVGSLYYLAGMTYEEIAAALAVPHKEAAASGCSNEDLRNKRPLGMEHQGVPCCTYLLQNVTQSQQICATLVTIRPAEKFKVLAQIGLPDFPVHCSSRAGQQLPGTSVKAKRHRHALITRSVDGDAVSSISDAKLHLTALFHRAAQYA